MAVDLRPGKRERAEAYALEAAHAERRGDHRAAARLYQAAFLALERNDENLVITDLPAADSEANDRPEAPWLVALLGEHARRTGSIPPDGGGEGESGE